MTIALILIGIILGIGISMGFATLLIMFGYAGYEEKDNITDALHDLISKEDD